MTEVKTKLRYYRASPRKVRVVADLIRGQSVKRAQAHLKTAPKRSAQVILKLLKSALANARHNQGLEAEKLYVKSIQVDQGPTLKRFFPRAFGRSAPIRKRTSHITLVLSEREK